MVRRCGWCPSCAALADGVLTIELPPVSWTVIALRRPGPRRARGGLAVTVRVLRQLNQLNQLLDG